ncbi:MAG: thiamine pyrophosphate-binding protein [Pirellulales bacterium]
MNGAQLLSRLLAQLGFRHAFGLPGTQNAPLYNELRRSPVRLIPATHELSAGFMALGYAATSGRPALLTLIGGPGISFATTPLLEALLDSIPLLCIVCSRAPTPGKKFGAQQIDLQGLGQATCKEVISITSPDELISGILMALAATTAGEPGPVLAAVDTELLTRPVTPNLVSQLDQIDQLWAQQQESRRRGSRNGVEVAEELVSRIAPRSRTLVFAGRGTLAAAPGLRRLIEHHQWPVVTTSSARGVIPEDHPLCLPWDLIEANVVQPWVDSFDHVVALGVKFSHNGSKAFQLRLDPQKLLHVDSSPQALNGNYPAAYTAQADVPGVIAGWLDRIGPAGAEDSLEHHELNIWRSRCTISTPASQLPRVSGVTPATPAGWFHELRNLLPRDGILVLDSGQHQTHGRSHYRSYAPGGLLFPTGLQSMGFAIPAAIGAQLAAPERPVVAVLGDGGLRMCGLDLLTAQSERLPLQVVVWDDGHYGLIRVQQLDYDGSEAGVRLPPMDYCRWSEGLLVEYIDCSQDLRLAWSNPFARRQPRLLHVTVGDTLITRAARTKSHLRGAVGRWWPKG